MKKADGSLQLFDREKVVRTCFRMGANKQTADKVAEKIERRLYDGISSAKILQMIFQFMRRHKPIVDNIFDLRKGLSLMTSKPEFEVFVQALLARSGFEVSPNRLLNGKCVEHEVDAIARKDGVTFFVEAKHHSRYHTPTGLDESRIARAVLEDVVEGFALGKSDLKIDRAMIVTNTRYSSLQEHTSDRLEFTQESGLAEPDFRKESVSFKLLKRVEFGFQVEAGFIWNSAFRAADRRRHSESVEENRSITGISPEY